MGGERVSAGDKAADSAWGEMSRGALGDAAPDSVVGGIGSSAALGAGAVEGRFSGRGPESSAAMTAGARLGDLAVGWLESLVGVMSVGFGPAMRRISVAESLELVAADSG
jgi:hypothetical protein